MSTALARTAAEEALGFQLPNRRMEDWRLIRTGSRGGDCPSAGAAR